MKTSQLINNNYTQEKSPAETVERHFGSVGFGNMLKYELPGTTQTYSVRIHILLRFPSDFLETSK